MGHLKISKQNMYTSFSMNVSKKLYLTLDNILFVSVAYLGFHFRMTF